MKNKTFFILGIASFALAACGTTTAIVAEPGVKKTFAIGDTFYLRGSFADNGWSSTYNDHPFIYDDSMLADHGFNYYLLGFTFSVNDQFKTTSGDWSWNYGGNNLTAISGYYFGSQEGNALCNVAGTYDIYVNTSAHTMGVVRSATQLMENQDKNYTRTTAICLNSNTWNLVKEYNHYSCITVNRTTEFIDNGLYMHSIDDTTNSGYMSKTGTTDMYHYTVSGGANYRDVAAQEIENVRHDSTTKNVNDFFDNGHYLHDNASTIAGKMKYDNSHDNYYLAYSEAESDLFEKWMHFVAPLFTNQIDAEGTKIPFTGLGIQDLGSSKVKLYLYADNSYLSNTNTYFATAEISAVGSTTIACLDKYIAGTTDLPTA